MTAQDQIVDRSTLEVLKSLLLVVQAIHASDAFRLSIQAIHPDYAFGLCVQAMEQAAKPIMF